MEIAPDFGLGMASPINLLAGITKHVVPHALQWLLASRTNTMLSIPLLFFMANGLTHKAAIGL